MGTATSARIPGFSLAGKTGTAQKFIDGAYSNTEFVSTFAALFPADNPRLVCIVAVDEAAYGQHFGSQAAAPVARNTIRRILNLDNDLYMPRGPVPTEAATAPMPLSAETMSLTAMGAAPVAYGIVPDFNGYSLRAALKLARRSGIDLRVTGSGQVISQSLEPGSAVNGEARCLLTLAGGEGAL